MSKRRGPSSSEAEHDRNCACTCTAKRARPQAQRRHLYVALDDRDKVYSVYKLNVDAGDGVGCSEQRLPEPPVLRLEVPKRRDTCLFAALDARIIALCANRSPTLVHDTHTAALAVGHRAPRALARASFTVPAAGRLYALPPRFTEDTCYLEPEEMAVSPDEEKMIIDKWVWNRTDSRSPVPFDPRAVTCHAVHPDGRTVFVSVRHRCDAWMDHGTFSLDAGRRGAEWTHHGDWLLPFKGRAFFEPQLDAWVGLDEDGHICSCNGMSRSRSRRAAPAMKVAKETLLREPDPGRRLDATLAHMGDGRFCLVERASHEAMDPFGDGDGDACVLHVTTFAVRYDGHGDLTVADRCHAGSYVVSTHDRFFKLQAFFL